MRSYVTTQRGSDIVREAGLEKLASNYLGREMIHPFIHDICSGSLLFNSPADPQFKDEVIYQVTKQASTRQDLSALATGLAIDEQTDSWRYLKKSGDLTLFKNDQAIEFTPALNVDKFVVSGLVGSLLVGFRNHYPILTKNGFRKFGLNNQMDAFGFVGAYIFSQENARKNPIYDESPSFSINQEKMSRKIEVSATLHGDFLITQTANPTSDVYAPNGQKVEYSPSITKTICAYHSVEPYIVGAILASQYATFGVKGTKELIDQFFKEINDIMGAQANKNYRGGFFGDFGDREALRGLTSLRSVMENGQIPKSFLSYPISPESTAVFEILPIGENLRIQNRLEQNVEEYLKIDIPKSSFADLFGALFQQTLLGLGRTAPGQLVDMLKNARKMLNES